MPDSTTDLTPGGLINPAIRRNHWMNQTRLHALSRPDDTAFRHLGETITWVELADQMERIAAAFVRRGVSAGDRVLVLTLNHNEGVLAVLGANSLGAIAVPINARLTPHELAYIIDDADSSIIVVDDVLAPLVQATTKLTDRLDRMVVVETAPGRAAAASAAAASPANPAPADPAPANPTLATEPFSALLELPADDYTAPDIPETTVCLLMYTSGTTGRPKGAMLDHVNMFSQAMTTNDARDRDEDPVVMLTAPLFHIAGWGQVAACIAAAVPVVIAPLGGFNPVGALDTYEAERITTVFNVPQQWQAICAAVRRGKTDAQGNPTGQPWNLNLRKISWGAAPASESVLREMIECFPDAEITCAFGQTEMSPVTCSLPPEDALRKIGSIGKPVPSVAARVVDPLMEDVEPGQVGEIVYRGPNLMQGYWNKPEETAKAFAGGWFHSGDLVRADDEGYLYIVDRAKDMIISGGENVYCTEVENALFDHPAILEAAVYGRADDQWGEVPVAAVVLREGATLTVDELREWLADRLARFKQPKDLVFLDELPRNAGGKVRKFELREQDSAA